MPVKKVATAITKTATAKGSAKKITTRIKAATTKVANKTSSQVNANARHIQENSSDIKSNSSMIHVLYGTIIVLMIIIAGLAFYVGQMMGNKTPPTTVAPIAVSAEEISVTIIDDARCSDCQTSAIMEQLKVLPFLTGAKFIEQDFSDSGVSQYLKDNNITTLPAVIFNSNGMNDGGQITPYLTALPDKQFSLALGATFDPFAPRSERGFLTLETSDIESLKASSPIDGNENAQITWIEYSDLECPYCAKLHNDGTPKSILKKYDGDVNIVFQHFPLDFHPNAKPGAEILECVNELSGAESFYSLSEASFANKNSTKDFLIQEAIKLGVSESDLTACIDAGKYSDKIDAQQAQGQSVFGITGTPGNVIINNATGEYEVVSGAYPASTFEEIIDRMLAE